MSFQVLKADLGLNKHCWVVGAQGRLHCAQGSLHSAGSDAGSCNGLEKRQAEISFTHVPWDEGPFNP